jgi:hypothetical protein
LQHTYNTMKVIIAGDFNVVWREKDSNSFHTRKPQTTRIFQQLMEDYELTDLGLLKGAKHTWYRKGKDYQSSRIDYVLTNLQLDSPTSMKPQVLTIFTIFDHVYLQTTFGAEITKRKPAMKDYILGSEEYIITAESIIKRIIQQQGILKPEYCEEVSEEERNDPVPILESRYQYNHLNTGDNAMTILNCIIGELDHLHNNMLRHKNTQSARQLQNTSKQLFQLQASLKSEKRQQEKEDIHLELTQCQKELANDLEAKNQATQMRIKNFYLAGNGTMAPQSFYIIKEKHANKTIRFLEVNNQEITDPAEIVKIMQEWYEKTAQEETIQTMELQDFLTQRGIQLPQLTEDQKMEMEQEFTMQEIKDALSEATEASAPGPSGHSIVFYKLLFMEIPLLFTEAINQLVFVPKLLNESKLQWIHNRKIIYIPKKLKPATPADYRPLSLLEVLYKIPSRILSKRITRVLPTIIGAHQHGFMAQKGIQEPSILVTHLIQDANKYGKPLQLISFDIEKAFDKVSHQIILQALEAFGFPTIYIDAIREYILTGHAYVEVNGQVGMYISIRTGSGQGDPMSSSLFLIASEPVNLAITTLCQQIMYIDRMGNQPNAILFADDNINPAALTNAQDILPLLNLYSDYKKVSGLQINMKKSMALCINTSQEVIDGLQELGISTPNYIKHLGIQLGKTIQDTNDETLRQVQTKALRRKILATTPPTDLLHRSLLVNVAYVPIYNHIFMALPIQPNQCLQVDKDIRSFLWTRQDKGQTKQKRRLIAKERISAPHTVGGLQISETAKTMEGFRLNLLQRIYKRIQYSTRFPPSLLPTVMNSTLSQIKRPSLQQHVQYLGPKEWEKTSLLLKSHNLLFSQCFEAGSQMIKHMETEQESWQHSPIIGHSMENIFPFTAAEKWELEYRNIRVIGQLFQEGDNGDITREVDTEMLHQLPANLRIKLNTLVSRINIKRLPVSGHRVMPITIMEFLLKQEVNMSSKYRQITRLKHGQIIQKAPAYNTRLRDNVYVPEESTFVNAYRVVDCSYLSTKTREVAFQILNRTIWTNNKAFKSGLAEAAQCERCPAVETMEHLLYGCPHYSMKVWEEVGRLFTTTIMKRKNTEVARINLTPREIVFNAEHPSIKLFVKDKDDRKVCNMLIQEVKRDIIYRRMNIIEQQKGREENNLRILAHIQTTLKKMFSYLTYCGPLENKSCLQMTEQMLETLVAAVE